MAELVKEKHVYKLFDDEVPKDTEVTVYQGIEPTLSLVGKEKIGIFSGNPISFKVPKKSRGSYFVYTFAKRLKIIAIREISLEGTFNTRDFGGYRGLNGRQVKWGTFYRSDALNNLTLNDVTILEKLAIKTIVDFRGEKEVAQAPDILPSGANYLNLSPNAPIAALASGNRQDDQAKVAKLVDIAEQSQGENYFTERLDEMSVQMRMLVRQPFAYQRYQAYLRLLLDTKNTPILHHCRGGKDRAGVATMLVLAVLGVPKEEIKRDYMRTKNNMAERNKKRMSEYQQFTNNKMVLNYLAALMQTKERYFDAAYDEIEKIAGSINNYLQQNLDLSLTDIQTLQDHYLYEQSLPLIEQ